MVKLTDKQLEITTRLLFREYLQEFNNTPKNKNLKLKPQIDKDNIITFMRII